MSELFPLILEITDGILQVIQPQPYEADGFAAMVFHRDRLVLIGLQPDQQAP